MKDWKKIFLIAVIIILIIITIVYLIDGIHIETDKTFIDYWSIGHFAVWSGIGAVVGYIASRQDKKKRMFGMVVGVMTALFVMNLFSAGWEFVEQMGWGVDIGMVPDSKINVIGDMVINFAGFSWAFWNWSRYSDESA